MKTRATISSRISKMFPVPQGTITIIRQNIKPDIEFSALDGPLGDVIMTEVGVIEDCENEVHVDFANEYIGGGVLKGGAVQEEIRFLTWPEALVSCLVCERMCHTEAIVILGAQRFSLYEGYNTTFKFKCRYKEEPKRAVERYEYVQFAFGVSAHFSAQSSATIPAKLSPSMRLNSKVMRLTNFRVRMSSAN